MGNSVSRVVGCFVPTGNDRSDRNGGGLVFSEPLDEGLGHSFCYVRPPHMESGRFSPDRYGLEDPDPMDLDQSFREDVPETTTFKAISGASVSANTATPKTVGDFHQIAAERAAAFEGSASFSHLPLQPVPRQTQSGPIVTTTDRSFMSAPLERGGGFLSGPLERSFLSGPLDNHHGSDCSHFSAPLGGGYPRKRRRYLSRVVKRARSVLGILRHHHSGVQEGFDSGMLYPNGDGGALQWAQGKAGEDRVHVVVSEEHGWVFVGIYDGFNGPDAPEFLMCNLYKSIYSQLQGLLWDRNPACSCARGDAGDASQQQPCARSEHGDSVTNPLSHQENAQQHGSLSNCGEGNGNHDNVVESSGNHVNVGKKDNFLGNSENNSHNIDNEARAEIGRENDSHENDVHKRVGDENDRHVNVVENSGRHADDDIGEKGGRENDSLGNFVNDAGKEVGGENDRHGRVGENSGGCNEDGENGDFNGGRVENVGEISKVETGKCSGCGENEQQENVGSDFIKRVSFHSDLKRSSRGKSLRELLAEEEDEGLDFSVWDVTVDKQKGEGELNSATVDGSENGRTVGEQRHRRGRSLLSSLMRQAYTRRKENHRKQVPWRYEVEKERIEVEKKEEGSARSCTHKCKVGPVDHLSVLKALSRALEVTEEAYLDMTDKVLDENPELALMGSCLLVMLMKDEDVYVMNVGDSRAIVAQRRPDEPSSNSNMMQSRKGHCRVASRDTHLRSELEDITEEPAGEVVSFRKIGNVDVEFPTQGSRLTALQLSTDHSTSIEEEVLRIKAEHPDDSQSIFNDRVKGRLKVTRAFGAGFLKQPKWNNALLEMFRNDYIGTAPYITCTPSLCHHRLGLNDQFIILSSDGLYQYLTNQEVVSHVELFMERNPDGDPAQHLIEELLFRAAKKAGMDFHDLLDIPQGDRRKYHDDVSVMVISLEGRIWKSSGKCL